MTSSFNSMLPRLRASSSCLHKCSTLLRQDSSNRQMFLEQMDLVHPRWDYVELSCSMGKALAVGWHRVVREKNGARSSGSSPGFTMLWRLCRGRHPSWTSRSSLSFSFSLLFLFSSFFPLSFSLSPAPGGKDTSRAARAPPLSRCLLHPRRGYL